MNTVSARLVLSIGLVVTGVGVLDAFFSEEWDLLVVFMLIAIVLLTLLLRGRANRIPVDLRPDLANWLEHRAEMSGEPFDDVLDRAVAWYRHGLYSPDAPDP